MPRAASTGAASRAASCVMLKRWRPIAPPRRATRPRGRGRRPRRATATTIRTPGPSARAGHPGAGLGEALRGVGAFDESRGSGWRSTPTFPPDAVPGHRNSRARGCVGDDITASGQGRSRRSEPAPVGGEVPRSGPGKIACRRRQYVHHSSRAATEPPSARLLHCRDKSGGPCPPCSSSWRAAPGPDGEAAGVLQDAARAPRR